MNESTAATAPSPESAGRIAWTPVAVSNLLFGSDLNGVSRRPVGGSESRLSFWQRRRKASQPRAAGAPKLARPSTTRDLASPATNRVSARANNAFIGALSIGLSSAKKTPLLCVQAPLGIAIPNDVRVGTPNGFVQTVKILTCTRASPLGGMTLRDPLLNVMQAANVGCKCHTTASPPMLQRAR